MLGSLEKQPDPATGRIISFIFLVLKLSLKKPTELTYKYILVVKYPNITEVVRAKTVYPLPSHSLARTDSI